jgi:cyanate lyase
MFSATTRRLLVSSSSSCFSSKQAAPILTASCCSSWRAKNSNKSSSSSSSCPPPPPPSTLRFYTSVSACAVAERVGRVLAAKAASGLSYDDLAQRLGVTNTYAAQLCLGQAKLSGGETAQRFAEALPTLNANDLNDMQTSFPMRSYDDAILKEPNVYRTYEAVMHYGEAIKSIINEQCGDGIMSAIDFYCDVGTTTGKTHGEKRVVITLNGKFLPFIEQRSLDNGAKSPRD